MRGGVCSERTTLAHLTSGTDSGSSPTYPTPTFHDYGTLKGEPGLGTMARTGRWPTPDTHNRKGRRAMLGSRENGRRSGGGQSSPPGLEQAVEIAAGIVPRELAGIPQEDLPPSTRRFFLELWPTPTARLGDSRRGMPSPELAERRIAEGRSNLDDAVAARRRWPTPHGMAVENPRQAGPSGNELGRAVNEAQRGCPPSGGGETTPESAGPLSPLWVEWLMGWPIGWTGLEPLATDRFREWLELHGC